MLAKKAYERSKDESWEASVSIMLSAMTLECYVNELSHRVSDFQRHEPIEELKNLGFLLGEYEKNKNSLQSKIELIHFCLSGEKADKGSKYFQDISMLIKLRNALVHRKPESTGDFGADPDAVYSLHPFTSFLVERGLIHRPSEKMPPVWSYTVSQPSVAAWAYNTVVEAITTTVSMLPDSTTKSIEEFTTKHEKI
ncbi:hypothetical protein [Microbulbifer sp. ANSA005]|uniref:hypothetical protein n=1 Tax=Microbulbifer sp. ANSA005 TaxID=3243362 RepID=UPI004043486A